MAIAVAAFFLVALGLQLLLAMEYREDPFGQRYVSDALSYDEWAQRIARQGVRAEPVFHQSPLFPVLLGWLYAASGEESRAARAIFLQGLLVAGAVALLVPLGWSWFRSVPAGIAAAALALLYGPVAFYGLKLLPVPLALFTQALALALLGAACRSGRSPVALACGAAWGIAFIARSETLLFLPVALAALWIGPGKAAGRPWARLAALVAGAALLVAPVALHNRSQGDSAWIAVSGGENLFIGNQRGGDGGHTALDPRAGDIFSQRALAKVLAEEELGRDLRPSEVSRYWRDRALQEVLAAPGSWVVLEARKLARILHPGDPTDIYSYPLERDRYLGSLHIRVLPTLGIWLLGGAGALLALRGARRSLWPLALFLAMHLAVLLAFFVSTRLRLPLLFFLLPFAGHAVVEGLRSWRAGRRRLLVGAVASVVALAAVHGLFLARPNPREVVRLASVLSTEERLPEALEVLEPLLREPDPDAIALDQAGWVLYKMGEMRRARERYVRALEVGLEPGRTRQTRTRLAWVHEKLGDLGAAERLHDAAVAGSADHPAGWYERAMFLLRVGRRGEAVRDLRRAREIAPEWPPPAQALRSLGVE